MATSPSSAAPARRSPRTPQPSALPAVCGPEDFPGCEPFHLPESELERYEGRLEFWDGRTHTAWRVREPTTLHHEGPTQMLAQVSERFAGLRGSRIKCFGSADLVRWEASGTRRWLMQADQVLYLHPDRTRPSGRYIDVDRDPLPDVVLEVDYSTDVRRRKLAIYLEGAFPEVWVLVPPRSRMGRRRLAMHVLDGEAYRVAPESSAFPGWKGEEIFGALTEDPWSDSTRRALERVSRAMGASEGTGPEDDPLSRTLILEGEARGRAQGHREGAARGRAGLVRELLRSRDVATGPNFEEALLPLALDTPAEALTAAALACTGEADFLHRVRMHEPRGAAREA